MSINLKAITTRLGYQQITSLSSSTALTVPAVDLNGLNCRPVIALITPEGQAVRWRDDNIAPTTTVGMPLAVGVTLQYDGDLTMIRFIEQVSGASNPRMSTSFTESLAMNPYTFAPPPSATGSLDSHFPVLGL